IYTLRMQEQIASIPYTLPPPAPEATLQLSLAQEPRVKEETEGSAISPKSQTLWASPSMAAVISSSSITATAPSARSLTRIPRLPSVLSQSDRVRPPSFKALVTS